MTKWRYGFLRWRAVIAGLSLGSLGCGGAASTSSGARPEGSPPASQGSEVLHQQHRGSSDEALTNAKMEDSLRKTMMGLPPNSGVHRIALADIGYPENDEENRKLAGFTLIVVTAVTHEPTELPPRVHFLHSGGDFPMPAMLSRIGSLDPSDLRQVFGAHRFDGLYAFPIQATQTQGVLVANFQNVTRDFRLLDFPSGLPAGVEPIAPGEPDMNAFEAFATREFPIVEERELAPAP